MFDDGHEIWGPLELGRCGHILVLNLLSCWEESREEVGLGRGFENREPATRASNPRPALTPSLHNPMSETGNGATAPDQA